MCFQLVIYVLDELSVIRNTLMTFHASHKLPLLSHCGGYPKSKALGKFLAETRHEPLDWSEVCPTRHFEVQTALKCCQVNS